MDTTEENVRMCEKAEEIQNSWIPQKYDYTWKKHYEGLTVIINRHQQEQITKYTGSYIWLPTQNQLQKLTDIKSIPVLLSQFNEFVFENVEYTSQFIDSCEKLWLAFVMKKCYKKSWNGKEWVKAKRMK